MIHISFSMLLIALLHFSCLYFLGESRFPSKVKIAVYSISALCFTAVITVIYKILNNDAALARALSYTVTIIGGFCVFFYLSSEPVCKKIFLFVNYSCIFCIFSCLAVIIIHTAFPLFSTEAKIYMKISVIWLFTAAEIIFYRCRWKKYLKVIPGSNRKAWYSVTLLSVLFLISFSILFNGCAENFKKTSYAVSLSMNILIYCAALWVIFCVLQCMEKEGRQKMIDRDLDYLKSQLESAERNENIARTIRHDSRHHSRNVAVMLENGQVEKAIKYINEYTEMLEKSKEEVFCPNITVNSILTSFSRKAKGLGFKFCPVADVREEVDISDLDFAAIISNALENAFAGCEECEKKGDIRINIKTLDNKIVIVCSNPCTEDLKIEDSMIKNKGIGVESIISAVSKYDGDISYEKKNGRLTLCVILPLRKNIYS